MSNQRVYTDVKRDHVPIFANLVQRLVLGLSIDEWKAVPGNLQAMQDMSGQLNKSEREQYPPGPTPPTQTPEQSLKARLAVGQNCAWGNLLTPPEHDWAINNMDADAVKSHVNFYNGSPVNCQEFADAASTSGFMYQWVDGHGTLQASPDVNGAADAYIATIPGVTAPPPLA